MSRLFGGWLHATSRLQVEKYGRDLSEVPQELYGEEVRQHVVGAIEELGEYLKEADWKPWKPRPQFASEEARIKRCEELVDVLHFIANLCVLEGLTDAELSQMYLDKVEKNRIRNDHMGASEAEDTVMRRAFGLPS